MGPSSLKSFKLKPFNTVAEPPDLCPQQVDLAVEDNLICGGGWWRCQRALCRLGRADCSGWGLVGDPNQGFLQGGIECLQFNGCLPGLATWQHVLHGDGPTRQTASHKPAEIVG